MWRAKYLTWGIRVDDPIQTKTRPGRRGYLPPCRGAINRKPRHGASVIKAQVLDLRIQLLHLMRGSCGRVRLHRVVHAPRRRSLRDRSD